jgi:hypothetical protein
LKHDILEKLKTIFFQEKNSLIMKRTLLSLAFFGLLATSIFAQREETMFSNSGLRFSGVWGGWNYNVGQFNKNYSNYQGGMWALEFGKKLLIGGSHYRFTDQPLDATNRFSLRQNGLLLGVMPYSYKTVHPIITTVVGSGDLSVAGEGTDKVFVLQPAGGLEINITRWCHLEALGGYRFVMGSEIKQFKDTDFSDFYGQLTLKLGLSWGRYNRKPRNYTD